MAISRPSHALASRLRTSSSGACLVSALVVGCLLSLPIAGAEAQITLDGSLGPSGSLTGPSYVISREVGQLRGTNLFHSFAQFNVLTGESATFTGPSFVTNVLSRVTGGQLSTIDGLISTRAAMPNANFYLLNPAGVLFGPNARLDVGGSVRVSTADYLRFVDGTAFFADLGSQSALSVADVAAFGFLRAPTAGITVNGSVLQVDPGKTLSLVGGDIQISGGASAGNVGALVANSGRIEIASVASAGEVRLVNAAGAPDLGVTSFSRLGSITISDGALLDVSGASGPSGSVVIRGGQLVADLTTIKAETTGNVSGAGRAVDVQVTGDAVFTSSSIGSATHESGDAGDIHVTADTLRLDNGTGIVSITDGSGRGPDIVVDVGSLHVTNGSAIVTSTSASPSGIFPGGPGGSVTVTARDSLVVDGGGGLASISGALTPSGVGGDLAISAPSVTLGNGAFVLSMTSGDAAGGRINLSTERLSITGGARIESHTGNAAGGVVSVTATESALISDAGSGILSSGFLTGTGETSAPAGEIAVTAGQLTVTRDAVIQSGSLLEAASNIRVTATDSIRITDGGGIVSLAFLNDVGSLTVSAPTVVVSRGLILASTTGTGRAGNIVVNVGDLSLSNGGQIVTSSIASSTGPGGNLTVNATGPVTISGRSSEPAFPALNLNTSSGLFSAAEAIGPAGTINVSTPALTLSDGGTISVATSGQGRGGDINIAAPTVSADHGLILASTAGPGRAGDIALNVGDLSLVNGSQIVTSSAAGATGPGGNLTLNATGSVTISGRSSEPVLALNPNTSSGLFSTAEAVGPAGTINVSTPALTMSDGGTISVATFGQGRGGDINIAANAIQLLNGASLVASSTGTAEALAGNINLTFGESFRLQNSSIATNSTVADGGSINITSTGSLLNLLDSQITTSVQSGVGGGGNITIGSGAHPIGFVILNGGQIRADAFGGPGGNISIFADTFLTSESIVSASSALSTPGTINIQAKFTNLSGNITQLPETVLQAAALLRAACAARLSAGKTSSLVVAGREGVPLEPGGVMPSPLIAESPTDLAPSRSASEWEPLSGAWRVSLQSKCSM
jgi:filamentous hemagglutinin family protein